MTINLAVPFSDQSSGEYGVLLLADRRTINEIVEDKDGSEIHRQFNSLIPKYYIGEAFAAIITGQLTLKAETSEELTGITQQTILEYLLTGSPSLPMAESIYSILVAEKGDKYVSLYRIPSDREKQLITQVDGLPHDTIVYVNSCGDGYYKLAMGIGYPDLSMACHIATTLYEAVNQIEPGSYIGQDIIIVTNKQVSLLGE